MDKLKKLLEEKLAKNLPSSIFLSNMRFLDESSRFTAAYQDPSYIPFYYFLGTFIKPKKVIEIGFKLGLFSGNLFKGCKETTKFLAFQEEKSEFYSARLAKSNVKDNYKGELVVCVGSLPEFEALVNQDQWDCVIFNEETSYDKGRQYLEIVWHKLNLNGIIVIDHLSKHNQELYKDFCKIKNRQETVVQTRYNVGLIQK
jgi:predicted O-methyltransferase YrrM